MLDLNLFAVRCMIFISFVLLIYSTMLIVVRLFKKLDLQFIFSNFQSFFITVLCISFYLVTFYIFANKSNSLTIIKAPIFNVINVAMVPITFLLVKLIMYIKERTTSVLINIFAHNIVYGLYATYLLFSLLFAKNNMIVGLDVFTYTCWSIINLFIFTYIKQIEFDI